MSEEGLLTELLATFAATQKALESKANELRGDGNFSAVLDRLDVRGYRSGIVVEGYVDAETLSGISVAWCFDARRNGSGWDVERSLVMNRTSEQEVVHEFPITSLLDSRHLISALPHLIEELLELSHSSAIR